MLGTMLYLDIKQVKDVMTSLDFQDYIGGTAALVEIVMKTTKGCIQLSSNYTFFSDSWFRGVKTTEEEN